MHLFEAQKQEVAKEELDKERGAPEDENEPFGWLAEQRVGAGLADAHQGGKEEASDQCYGPEVDVPDHAGPNEGELVTQCEILARQQALTIA